MDRVFSQATWSDPAPADPAPAERAPAEQAAIEVEVRDATRPRQWHTSLRERPWLVGLSCGLVVLISGGSLALWRGWNQASHDLRQERTLRLLESVRALGPAPASEQAKPAAGDTAGPNATASANLPPPPPNEPWIEELSQLNTGEAGGGGSPLRVPLNGPLNSPVPAAASPATSGSASTSGATAAALPELLGVVQIPGKPGSAIFQVGGSSTNALVGESIGGSGWRLQATSTDSAVIERGGVSRRISISSGF
jgi:hypothetical protein